MFFSSGNDTLQILPKIPSLLTGKLGDESHPRKSEERINTGESLVDRKGSGRDFLGASWSLREEKE